MLLGLLTLFIVTVTFARCNVDSGPKEKLNAGEYIYYNLTSVDSYVYLQLISLTGDCDLYVSQNVVYPTYQDYTMHSATCGIDSVIILKRMKGPFHIGIYGHPTFETSTCILNVCLLEHPEKHDEFMDELTELSGLTDTLIEQTCHKDTTHGKSYVKRSFDILARIVTTIEIDSIILEIISAFAQAVI